MTDPKRWRDPGADAPSHLRELVERAPRTHAMSAADRARAAASIGRLATVKPVATIASGLWVKAMVVMVSIGMAGGAVVAIHGARATHAAAGHVVATAHRATSPAAAAARTLPSEPVPAPAPAAVPPVPVPAETMLPIAAIAPLVAVRAAPLAHRARPDAFGASPAVASPAPAVADEASRSMVAANAAPPALPTGLVGAIDPPTTNGTAPETEDEVLTHALGLVATDPSAALRLLDADQARFPNSRLADMRTAWRVRALIRLGRVDEARACGQALIDAQPHGLAAHLVRSSFARLAPASP